MCGKLENCFLVRFSINICFFFATLHSIKIDMSQSKRCSLGCKVSDLLTLEFKILRLHNKSIHSATNKNVFIGTF